ncbi:MAG: ATP-binding protein [bacterium]
MKSKTLYPTMNLPRPGFFTRLGNIIIVQVFFVFAAVALLVFFPGQENPDSSSVQLRPELQRVAEKTMAIMGVGMSGERDWIIDEKARRSLSSLFQGEESIVGADIYLPVGEQGLVPVYSFGQSAPAEQSEASGHSLSRLVDQKIIMMGLSHPETLPITSMSGSRYVLNYYSLADSADPTAVLAILSEHNLVISSRPHLKYALLVLFLCSVLVSLLTVYLISRRFQGPLDRLIHGLQQTAQGERFILLETEGDAELKKLITAFNSMSEALWQNHRKLKESNYLLSRANHSFLQAQLFLAALIDSSPTSVMTADPGGRIMTFNRQAVEAFGYDSQDALGMNVDELITNVDHNRLATRPLSTSNAACEILCRRCDGSVFPAFLVATPILTDDRIVTAYLYHIRDISESKSFQEMMIRLDRYYTRGKMAGQIAHEINNYLAVLSGNTELLPLHWEKHDEEKFRRRVEVIKQTVDRIARFTDGLMDADPDDAVFSPTDINQLVQNTLAFLKPQNKFDNIEVITKLSSDLSLAAVDAAQIQQVLVNLLYNASEAVQDQEGHKTIRVGTALTDNDSRKSVLIEVSDNGPGLTEDKQHLLFVKRFTTKRKSNGIGLITCRKIIDIHGGDIAYREDGGAVFSIVIPLQRPQRHQSSTSVSVPESAPTA